VGAVKQFSPASERNRQPILDALLRLLPPTLSRDGRALEIASGTGQHIAHFAQHLPGWQWQPSDATDEAFESITAWCAEAGVRNVAPPVLLDVMAARWPSATTQAPHSFDNAFDLVYCANMLHISPWATCAALMQGAARHLAVHGLLVTYGPYLARDVPTSPGNLAFDESLRQRNPAWGIRALEDVVDTALLAGLTLKERVEMPANNLLLVFESANSRVNTNVNMGVNKNVV
jgi:SAM-dependent methyltransferase